MKILWAYVLVALIWAAAALYGGITLYGAIK